MPNTTQKLYIVMTGLPARGKSTIAARIKESFLASDIATEIFNNGDLRRQLIDRNTAGADFYDPNNTQGTALREHIAITNIKNAAQFIHQGGDVAILDATNVSRKRRELILSMLTDHPVLFIETVNSDPEILEANINRKARLPEFAHFAHQDAVASFKERIQYYEHIASPFQDEANYIQVDSLHNKILKFWLNDHLPHFEQLRDLLVTDYVKNLFLVRHGQTTDNTVERIGGDAPLTEKGQEQALRLSNTFESTPLPYIFCSQKQRTWHTAKPICDKQSCGCTLIQLEEFNEIDAGICEEMTYEQIKTQKPDVYYERLMDKYNYVYPQGEGYVSMRTRIDRGVKKALFLSGNADNIVIVGHRAVNRMILAHFLYRRIEDVPYIYVPQNQYYHIISMQQKKLFELKKIN
ncbi:MAG: 6-phosphofructo-2-kinase/fructose-2,6-bisphosphatase [Desulfovermiculus sp.]|nr:6-phosphofructo-2-kinase/fructose-2,6-bisphosphatase [Desulfovermiculus sp.]